MDRLPRVAPIAAARSRVAVRGRSRGALAVAFLAAALALSARFDTWLWTEGDPAEHLALFFYGYGLAMYGALGPAEGVLLALAVYGLEATIAMLWLRRFAIGPLEWAWRAVTYLRVPSFRRGP